jgi:hypothetical protein
VKQDEFQDEVYKTVQNLSKEINEAFTLIHKNANLATTMSNTNMGKDKND